VRRAEYHVTPAIVDEPGTFESFRTYCVHYLAVDPVEVIRQAANFLSEEFRKVAEAKEAAAGEVVVEEQAISMRNLMQV